MVSLITITYETTVFTPEKYILPTFYYVISVRRFRSLPASVFPADIPVPLGSTSGGRPCLRLTLPTADRVVVLHNLVVAHAGRT